MTLYSVGYEPRADDEYWRLPPRLQRELRHRLKYQKAGPFRSYPAVSVKEVEDVPGAWRFHLSNYRIFYRVDGLVIWVTMIWEDRPSAYSESTLRELRRRMKRGVSKVTPSAGGPPRGEGLRSGGLREATD